MADTFSALQSAAHAGAFGAGSRATPTPEQIRAGNYAKGATRLHGMPITIETPMFQPRRGKADGVPWSVLCMAHYGYINGTVGADGDAVDVFVGPVPESLRVFVVNQQNKDGGFDEHKVMLGFADEQSARDAYMNSYEKGWTGLASLTPCSVKQFKYWLKHGDLTRPLVPGDLINDEAVSMTDVFARWDDQRMPVGATVMDLITDMRRTDNGLMMDAATMGDLVEYLSDGSMLDAMVIEVAQFERKANQLLRVMQMAATSVKPSSVEVSKAFKNRGTTQLAMLFVMDDGQSVSVFFHNPDTTPNKLAPTDEMVSWKWVLNKKDITITVAPEKGQDLNPREVARRVMKLVEKNSAKFILANTNKAASSAQIEALKADEAAKTTELADLDKQIADLTAELEAKKAAPTPAAQPETLEEVARRLVPEEFKADIDPDGFTATAADGYGIRLRVTAGDRMLTSYILKPGVNGQESMGSSTLANGIESAVQSSVSTAMLFITKWRESAPTKLAADDSSVVFQGPAGPVTVAKTKYVETGEWGVSWASTHLATAPNKAEGVAIAERVIASGAVTIDDMRAALVAPVPIAEAVDFSTWQAAFLGQLSSRMQISDGDADAVATPHAELVDQLFADGKTPEQAAEAVQAAATVAPQTPEEAAMVATNQAELAERAAQEAPEALLSQEPGADEDTGTIEAEGRDNTVKTAKGTKVLTGFKVIEARNLVLSHETDGTSNPDYPAEIQPRDRARATSQAWVQKTARNLDPDSLGRTQRADSGAPIVGPDRVVESGNGRGMAIREAYRIGAADEYREWLVENAEYFGVDVAKINRMKAPVLVRVRKSAVDRVAFAVEANQDDKLAMTATEKARSDAKRLDNAMLAKLADGDLNSAANRDFVAAFLQSLGDAEAAQYLTTDGKPTSGLISRLQAALFAGAYSDDRLLEMTADVAKPEIANIVAALNSAAPDFIRAKEQDRIGAEQAGEQVTDSVELSLNQEAVNAIIGATNVLRQAKESGLGLDEFLRQGDMFGGTDPAVAAMAMFIQQNNRSAKRMGTAFKAMAQFVESENARKQTASLFGDAPVSFADIVGAANRKLEQEYGEGLFAIDQGDMFATPAPAPTAEPAPSTPPEPDEDDQLKAAKAYLDSLIEGTTDLGSPPEVLARLESIYAQWGEAELKDLFVDASNAYRDYALKVTAEAL